MLTTKESTTINAFVKVNGTDLLPAVATHQSGVWFTIPY